MKKFNLFLVVSLGLTAFLVGYLAMGGLGPDSKSKTGTILDKFASTGTTNETSGQTDQQSAIIETGKPFLIADRGVTAVTNSPDRQGVIYYELGTGKVFEYNFNNNKESVVSDTSIPNFISSLWSPNKKEVISAFYTTVHSDFRYYNFDTGKSVKLSPYIDSLDFSPDGNFMAYYYFDDTNTSDTNSAQAGKIVLSQPDGTYPKTILNTRLENPKITWVTKDTIALETDKSEVFLLSTDGKLNKFMDQHMFFKDKWSLSGKKILFSALKDGGDTLDTFLSVKDTELKQEIPLGVSGDASLCAWSLDDINVFCALHRSSMEDDIYLINTSDGSKKLVAETGMVVKKLLLTNLEDYVLLVNASNNKLYGVKISD